MQRLITLDSVIYVHENPRRSRRPAPAAELAAAEEPEVQASYSEPSADWSTEELAPEPEPEPEVLEVSAAVSPEATVEAEAAAELEPEPEPEPEPVARFTENRKTVVRSAPIAPPPGYAIEFGTGRLVPIHSFKGRMSYPTGR